MEDVLQTYGSLKRVQLGILPSDGTFASILSLISSPANTYIAFDFDQTLKIHNPFGIRGGDESLNVITSLFEQGSNYCIITAQPPTTAVVKILAQDLHRLNVEKFFDVENFPTALILAKLLEWGPTKDLSLERLTMKFLLLFVMYTDRYVVDLHRIVYSATVFGESVNYKLAGPMGSSTLSGLQKISNPVLVECFKEYVTRTTMLTRKQDRLFVQFQVPEDPSEEVDILVTSEIERLVKNVLEELEIPEKEWTKIFSEPAKEIKIDESVVISNLGDTIASRYNKPEAYEWWLKSKGVVLQSSEPYVDVNPERKMIIFIDDNSDNVFNMYIKFANYVIQQQDSYTSGNWDMVSLWFPPPEGGREEAFDEISREILLKLAKNI